jgi:hypothetical protein
MALAFLINPRYTLSRFEPRVSAGKGGGPPMGRPGGVSRPAVASAAPAAALANGGTPAPALAATNGALATAQASNGAAAPETEQAATEAVDVPRAQPRPVQPREYMAASVAPPPIHDYMGNGNGHSGNGANGADRSTANGDATNAASSGGAPADGGTSYGLPPLEAVGPSNGPTSGPTNGASYGLQEPQTAAPANGRSSGPSNDGPASDGPASGNGSGEMPPPIDRAASDYGRGHDATKGNGASSDRPPERVELPARRRAGTIERTTIAAITATVVAGALSSLLFRRR